MCTVLLCRSHELVCAIYKSEAGDDDDDDDIDESKRRQIFMVAVAPMSGFRGLPTGDNETGTLFRSKEFPLW